MLYACMYIYIYICIYIYVLCVYIFIYRSPTWSRPREGRTSSRRSTRGRTTGGGWGRWGKGGALSMSLYVLV